MSRVSAWRIQLSLWMPYVSLLSALFLDTKKLYQVHYKVRLRAATSVAHSWCQTQNAVTGTGHQLSVEKFIAMRVLLSVSCKKSLLNFSSQIHAYYCNIVHCCSPRAMHYKVRVNNNPDYTGKHLTRRTAFSSYLCASYLCVKTLRKTLRP